MGSSTDDDVTDIGIGTFHEHARNRLSATVVNVGHSGEWKKNDNKPTQKVVWLGGIPKVEIRTKTKKGRTFENAILSFHTKNNYLEVLMEKEEGEWLIDFIKELKLTEKPISYQKMKQSFEEATNSDFEVFIYSKAMNQIKEEALLIV